MFLTGVTYKRIPLFRYRKPCQIFVEHLSFYRQKYGFKLHGFVIMPNHFHLLIHLPPHHELADFLREFKGSSAKQILDWIKRGDNKRLLSRLSLGGSPKRRKDSRHAVWQRNNYATGLLSAALVCQKLYYLHDNPRREGLVKRPEEYPWSSASIYAGGKDSAVEIDLLVFP